MGNAISTSLCSHVKVVRKVYAAAVEEEEDEFEDPVERMLKKTGCLEKHYSVQECIAETKDWRQCQGQVQAFKECMEKYKRSTLPSGPK